MGHEMTTATIVHLTGYPSEQNWNVSVNQLLNRFDRALGH